MSSKNHNHMMYGSWDNEWDRLTFLSFWAIFCPFNTLPLIICTKKLQLYEAYMVPEIWSATDIIFCHSRSFLLFYPSMDPENQNFDKMKKYAWRYYHFTQVYGKWKSYDVWFLRYEAWHTDFFVILDRVLHFYPPNNPKNQNFEKLKESTRDIIILHKCTKNYDLYICYIVP